MHKEEQTRSDGFRYEGTVIGSGGLVDCGLLERNIVPANEILGHGVQILRVELVMEDNEVRANGIVH